jgi:hypothetical protein
MAQEIDKRLTEPTTVADVFCTGVDVELHDGFVRLVGCSSFRIVSYETPPEARIVGRLAMPTLAARALLRDLRKALAGRH